MAIAMLTAVTATQTFGNNTVTIGASPSADVTDWFDEFCVEDNSCGANSSQTDGKGACIASNYPTSTEIYLRYDFDEVGVSGANTMDGCWMVDVDQNGNADRALCFSLDSSGGLASSITATLYTCNDSAPTTCGMDQAVTSSAVCAFNNDVPDGSQLLDCAVGDKDLAVECSVSLADLGWTSNTVELLQGCSSSSDQPNSSTFDCFGSPDSPLIIDPENGDNSPVELLFFTVE